MDMVKIFVRQNIAVGLLSIALLFACVLSEPAKAGRIEAGTFTAHDTFNAATRTPQFVPFQQTFDVPPIVVAIGSSNGSNSASVRITNVTTTGFDELILEPPNWDGRHVTMVTHYIAVEPGRHVLPGGAVIEAGHINTSAVQFGSGFTGGTASWANVTFSKAMSSVPTILHNLQTANSEANDPANTNSQPHITSIAQNPSITGFQIALDRSQANSGPWPTTEQIGWIAFPDGGSGSFDDTSGTSVDWNAATSGFNIRGWDNGCFSNSTGLTNAAVVVAKKLSRRNDDGGWFRFCTINATTISVRIDEDRDQDTERNVAAADAERAGIIAFSRNFHADLAADLITSKVKFSTTGTYGDFDLPDAVVEYAIDVTNQGNAPPNYDSVIVTDQLPSDLALIVTDFAGPGSGPVQFADGSPSTNLTCNFISLASTSDCIDFSTDGSNFGYTPIDSGDGTDPAVTHIRARPVGAMGGDTGSGDPNFELRLRARIK